MQALAKWKEQHQIKDDDTILLLMDLFRIHQSHWDQIRHRQMPSLDEFNADIAALPEDDISAAYSAETFHKIKCSRTKADYSRTTAGISPGRSLPGWIVIPRPFPSNRLMLSGLGCV